MLVADSVEQEAILRVDVIFVLGLVKAYDRSECLILIDINVVIIHHVLQASIVENLLIVLSLFFESCSDGRIKILGVRLVPI